MSFDVREFMARVGPPQRNNKYELTVDQLPPALSGTEHASVYPDLRFHCEAVDTPASLLMTQETRRYGYGPVEVKPYAPAFAPLQIVIVGDQDGRAFRFFRAWQASTINYEFDRAITDTGYGGLGVYQVAYKTDYAVQVSITTYGEDGTPSETLVLREAYPSLIGSVPLAWAMTNTHSQLPVSLTFFDYRTIRRDGY